MRNLLWLAALLTTACVVGDENADPNEYDETELEGESDEATDPDPLAAGNKGSPGVNGDYCKGSPFNCRFRYDSSRVVTGGGSESWGVDPGASVRDGAGNVLFKQTGTRMTFNYGQTRLLAGKAHALALTTTNNSAGWYPIDRILGEASFRARNGEVNGKDTGGERMACYEIRNSHDASIELKKVVRDSTAAHERAGDYLPLKRENGERSANLVFSVPGFGLGGATTDHFRAGTKFHRISVPTATGKPSITVPLYVKNGDGRYLKESGALRFFYGFIVAGGAKRFGWMAEQALQQSTGCP